MIDLVLGGGVGCILAYGQTGGLASTLLSILVSSCLKGSGKTFTMEALEQYIAQDIFPAAEAVSARLLASQSHIPSSSDIPDVSMLTIDTPSHSKNVFEITATFLELLGKKATDLLQVAAGNYIVPMEVPIMENRVTLLTSLSTTQPNSLAARRSSPSPPGAYRYVCL